MTTEALPMPEKPAQPDHDRPYWTVAQYAGRLQCSDKKVYRLIKKGEIIAHRFGNQLRIPARPGGLPERFTGCWR